MGQDRAFLRNLILSSAGVQMVRWVKVLAAKPAGLSLIPRIHIMEENNGISWGVF